MALDYKKTLGDAIYAKNATEIADGAPIPQDSTVKYSYDSKEYAKGFTMDRNFDSAKWNGVLNRISQVIQKLELCEIASNAENVPEPYINLNYPHSYEKIENYELNSELDPNKFIPASDLPQYIQKRCEPYYKKRKESFFDSTSGNLEDNYHTQDRFLKDRGLKFGLSLPLELTRSTQTVTHFNSFNSVTRIEGQQVTNFRTIPIGIGYEIDQTTKRTIFVPLKINVSAMPIGQTVCFETRHSMHQNGNIKVEIVLWCDCKIEGAGFLQNIGTISANTLIPTRWSCKVLGVVKEDQHGAKVLELYSARGLLVDKIEDPSLFSAGKIMNYFIEEA